MLAGRYELGERLGRGGMGTVWRARDRMLDREVAVKELTVSHLPEEDLAILQSRMKQEARAAARIKHPGVITIHDVLEQDGRPWIVMELIDGRSLADVIAQDGTLTPRDAAEVGAQVLAALHRGHQLGVLHRDVKPANVLLERGTGRAVLLDFGIARLEGSSELTRPGDLVGSPDYLAPERAQGERPGAASDLWGLGATLYAAVEGQSPFRRDNPLSTLAAVVDEPLPEPTRAGALGPVLAALMAKQVADRPGADEALRMLREVTAGHTVGIKLTPRQALRTPTQVVPVVDRRPVDRSAAPEQGALPAQAPPPKEQGPTGPTRVGPPAQAAGPRTEAAAPRRRGGLWLVLAGLLAAVLGGTGAFLITNELHQRTPVADLPVSDAPSTPDGPAPQESSTPQDGSPSPGRSPSGYTLTADPAGFRFQLPDDGRPWVRSVGKNQIYYSPDNQQNYLQFAVAVGQPTTPLQHFQEMEHTVSLQPGYKVVSQKTLKFRGHDAAFWEWTQGQGAAMRHMVEEEFIDTDGTSYAILQACPEANWLTGQRIFQAVLNNFTVAK